MRTHNNNLTVREFHRELLSTIRAEFEHNLTQQIYMSDGAWEAVRRTKEETVKLVNIAASKLNEDARAIDLSKAILDICMRVEKLPTQGAIDLIKG